jgi:hypothetical protein
MAWGRFPDGLLLCLQRILLPGSLSERLSRYHWRMIIASAHQRNLAARRMSLRPFFFDMLTPWMILPTTSERR